MANTNDAEQAALQQQINEEMQKFGRILPDTQARLMDAQTGIKNFGFKVDVASKTVGKLGDAVANTAKAMYNGEKGAAAFNKTVDDLTDAAQIAATGLALLVPGGPLIKAAVAGITYLATSALKAGAELTKTANSQSDALYSAFQKMSASGASASDGMTGMFNDLQNLGLGIQDLDGYIGLINDSSKDLALFGGTVYKGRQAFSEMNKEMEPFTEQLYNAGLTQQDIAKGAMDYLKLQTTLGRSQTMTNKQLADGARKYLLEQDALAKLTGQSRQEMEAQQQAALMEEQYAAKIRELELQGNTQAVESLKKMNAVYSAAGPEVGRAFRASVTGNLTNADALKYNISSQGEMIKTTEEVISGQRDWKDAVTKTGRAIGDTADGIGTTLGQLGTYNEGFGNFAEQQKLRLMTEQDIGKKYEEINQELEKQGATGKKAQDELQQTQTEIREMQKDAMLATQKLVQLAVPAATDAMWEVARAAKAAAEALLPGGEPTQDDKNWEKFTSLEKLESGSARVVEKIGAFIPFADGLVKEAKAGRIANETAYLSQGKQKREANAFSGTEADMYTGGQLATAAPSGGGGAPSGGGVSSAPAAPAPARPAALPVPPESAGSGRGSGDNAGVEGGVQMGDAVRVGGQIRKGGSVAWRTNNPGNVSWSGIAKQFGAIGTWKNPNGDQQQRGPGIAILPSEQAGESLKMAQWRRPKYIDLTIDAGVQQWAEGARKQGYGSGYARDLAKAAGATLDTVIGTLSDSQLQAMVQKQRKWENWKEGQIVQASGGGVFDGPRSGYPATLHGPEAVIPLKNGSVPVSMSEEFNMTAVNLGELVNIMKNNVGMQNQMLTVLDEIRRAQTATADNTGRMVAHASN